MRRRECKGREGKESGPFFGGIPLRAVCFIAAEGVADAAEGRMCGYGDAITDGQVSNSHYDNYPT